MEKEINTVESDFNENEIPDLNSFKPFEFEPKRNIGDINSSNSDYEEKVIEYTLFSFYKNNFIRTRALYLTKS